MFARRRDLLEREAERHRRARRPRRRDRSRATSRGSWSTTVGAFGGIDVVVNNGGGPPPGPAVGAHRRAVEGAVELLLLSAIRLTKLAFPISNASGRGRIVNIESSSVRAPIDNLALSNAVRPGVVGWTKTLSREVGPKGITVNTIAPGLIDTERLRLSVGGVRDVCVDPDGPRRRAGGDRRRCLFPGLRSRGLRHRGGRAGRRRRHAQLALRSLGDRAPPPPPLPGTLIGTGLLLIALTAAALWIVPSDEYLFLPDKARPVAPLVTVKGGKDPGGPGGIYYDAVIIRRAKLFERIFPWIHDGSTLVPDNRSTRPESATASAAARTSGDGPLAEHRRGRGTQVPRLRGQGRGPPGRSSGRSWPNHPRRRRASSPPT